jgi:hypothetical protein
MWSLTSLRTKRIRSFRKFRLLPPKDFFDSIGQSRPQQRAEPRSALPSIADITGTCARGQLRAISGLMHCLTRPGPLAAEEVRIGRPVNHRVRDYNGSDGPFVFVIHAPMDRPQSVINRRAHVREIASPINMAWPVLTHFHQAVDIP